MCPAFAMSNLYKVYPTRNKLVFFPLYIANFCGCPALKVYNDHMGSYSDKSEVSTVSP
jgi:hypothetical protein